MDRIIVDKNPLQENQLPSMLEPAESDEVVDIVFDKIKDKEILDVLKMDYSEVESR